MSLFDAAKLAVGINPTTSAGKLAPQIAAQLGTARKALVDLQKQRGELALAVSTGEAEADAKMSEWRGRVAQQENIVADLIAAHTAALQRDADTEAATAAKQRETAIRSVTQKLAYVHKASVKARAAIENLAIAFEEITRLVEDARATAKNSGLAWPDYTMVNSEAELRDMLRIEMFRVGHGVMRNNGTYPAGLPGKADFMLLHSLEVDSKGHNVDDNGIDHGPMRQSNDGTGGSPFNPSHLRPLDKVFDTQRQHILAIVRGDVPSNNGSGPVGNYVTPAAPVVSEPADIDELLGTPQPEPADIDELLGTPQPEQASSPQKAEEATVASIPMDVLTGSDMKLNEAMARSVRDGDKRTAEYLKSFGHHVTSVGQIPESQWCEAAQAFDVIAGGGTPRPHDGSKS